MLFKMQLEKNLKNLLNNMYMSKLLSQLKTVNLIYHWIPTSKIQYKLSKENSIILKMKY